jgi:predicted PurR-regulated permease PerM
MPTTHQTVRYLQIIFFVVIFMYFTQAVTVPMAFGLLIAIVMAPFCQKLEKMKWPRSLAITACLAFIFLLATALVVLLAWQLDEFQKEIPKINTKFREVWPQIQQWLQNRFHLTEKMLDNWLIKTGSEATSKIGSILVGTFNVTANLLFNAFMIPLFAALFLYYRGLIMKFLYEFFGMANQKVVHSVSYQTVQTYHNYIKGLLLVYLSVGVLNSIGLAIIGIEYAILFGFITSILTIIPYVGILVGALLPISIAWISHDSLWYPLAVVAVFAAVQYLEANVIFPMVVGSQLKVNTLASLIALFLGGVIWGVSGMVLFLPFVAILKVIADHVPAWKPISTLLGPTDN